MVVHRRRVPGGVSRRAGDEPELDVSAPLPLASPDGTLPALAVALGVGITFGWWLERAGLGSARKLMGQFRLTDLTVFKVMFTAIVTAMLGLFWLGWLGAVDLAAVHVPETFAGPQLAGGIVFGAGMALAGLCPGTSCVAAATGRIDGIAVMSGFLAGVMATALALPAIGAFYTAGARGVLTLGDVAGVAPGTTTLAVVTAALVGFAAAERVERAMARRAVERAR
jgi:uncharacterized membrane protein YedE/YeeE